jgi:hypothetical protein
MARPEPMFSPDELQAKIDEYFAKNPEHPTMSGLAHYLGFASRQSLYDYQEREESSYIIKSALLLIEAKHEENIYTTGAAGSIFWLKNRGWTDQQQIQHSGGINIQPVEWVKSEDQ